MDGGTILLGNMTRHQNDLSSGLDSMQIVSPLLHHLPTLWKVRGPIVSSPVGVPHCMGELVLDVIGANAKYLVKNRPSNRAESVSAHFVLVDSHTSHGRKNRIVAHRTPARTSPRKNEASISCKALQFTQTFYGLSAQWNDVRSSRFGDGVAPLSRFEVDVRSFSGTELARSDEKQGREA